MFNTLRYNLIKIIVTGGLIVTISSTFGRISDKEFINNLHLSNSGLEEVSKFAKQGQWTKAMYAYGRYLKLHRLALLIPDDAISPNPAIADKYIEIANNYGNAEWHLILKEIKAITPLFNRHRYLLNLSQAYFETKEEKYAKLAVSLWGYWIENSPLNAEEPLNTAVRLSETWPFVLHKLSGSTALDVEVLGKICKSYVEQIIQIFPWTPHYNIAVVKAHALYVGGTLLLEYDTAEYWRSTAVSGIRKMIIEDFYPDGAYKELTWGYQFEVLRNIINCYELAHANGIGHEIPYNLIEYFKTSFDFALGIVRPDRTMPNRADSIILPAFFTFNWAIKYFPEDDRFLWMETNGEEGTSPDFTSIEFPYSGYYVMRSDWSWKANYMFFLGGPRGDTGHGHEDKLHMDLYAYGRQLLLDGGFHSYTNAPERWYSLLSYSHNTIVVDQYSQARWKSTNPKDFLTSDPNDLDNIWKSTPKFDYVVSKYESGYGNPFGNTLESNLLYVTHKRSVVFIKPDYWVVFDVLIPHDNQAHDYASIFHFNADTVHTNLETLAVTTQNKDANLIVWPAKHEDMSVFVVKGLTDPVQGWAIVNNWWTAVPTAVYQINRSATLRLATVLYPVKGNVQAPIENVSFEQVYSRGRKADDAVAVRIRYKDGTMDIIMDSDSGNTTRQVGQYTTTSQMFGALTLKNGTVSTIKYH